MTRKSVANDKQYILKFVTCLCINIRKYQIMYYFFYLNLTCGNMLNWQRQHVNLSLLYIKLSPSWKHEHSMCTINNNETAMASIGNG